MKKSSSALCEMEREECRPNMTQPEMTTRRPVDSTDIIVTTTNTATTTTTDATIVMSTAGASSTAASTTTTTTTITTTDATTTAAVDSASHSNMVSVLYNQSTYIAQRHRKFLMRSSVVLILSKQNSFTIAFEDISRESRFSKVVW